MGAGSRGGNNSAVEVVNWRQKIETWLCSKLWAIEHRLLTMISLYRLYFTALTTGSAILASTFSSTYLSRLCSLVGLFVTVTFYMGADSGWDKFRRQLASGKMCHHGELFVVTRTRH
jgi:hypothetical protein